MNKKLSRRKFLSTIASVIGSSVFGSLTGCAPGEAPVPVTAKKLETLPTASVPNMSTATAPTTPKITATPTPVPVTVTPTSTPAGVTPSSLKILRNQNLERVNIRYSRQIAPVDIDTWRLGNKWDD
ncbi:MAG: hypothetical protein E4H27_08890 [Anaerolineales bacterium]|nr:MAG: hypothetical protein E4H27_08890 [Anaerolineales bacterium]